MNGSRIDLGAFWATPGTARSNVYNWKICLLSCSVFHTSLMNTGQVHLLRTSAPHRDSSYSWRCRKGGKFLCTSVDRDTTQLCNLIADKRSARSLWQQTTTTRPIQCCTHGTAVCALFVATSCLHENIFASPLHAIRPALAAPWGERLIWGVLPHPAFFFCYAFRFNRSKRIENDQRDDGR